MSLGPRALGGAAGPAHWRGSEREGPRRRAGSCGTICYAGGGARPSVCLQTRLCVQEKQGSSSRRGGCCQPGRRGRRGPGVGDVGGDRYAEGAASLSAPPSTCPLLPAPQPTRKGSRSRPPTPTTSRGTLSRPWEQQYPRKSASRIKGGDAHSGILLSYFSLTE